MSHIFISYSRRDLDFAGRIVQALADNNLDTWVDWKSIPKGEDWEQEIYRGIEEADAFLFLISPDSVASEPCNKEIAHAIKNGKRILPIFIANVDDRGIYGVTEKFFQEEHKKEISRLNFIKCREGRDDFDKAIEEIRTAIHTDYEWLRYHTKLQVKALDWERRKDNSRLLRGKELREAEQRLTEVNSQTEPQPTDLQQEYVRASRKNEERQRRRVIVGLGFGLLALVILSIFAWRQRISSVAEASLRATAQANAEQQTRVSLSRKLAAEAQAVLSDHPQESLLLAIEALNALESGDPSITNGEQSLRDALLRSGGLAMGRGISFGLAPVISPDNRWLAAGNSDGTIKLWDLNSPTPADPMLIYAVEGNSIQAITITEDSRWLIAAGPDLVVQLWDLTDFKPDNKPLKLPVNDCPVYMLKASPDNHWLIIICENDSVKVWDLAAHNAEIPPVPLQRAEVSTNTGGLGIDTIFLPGNKEQLVSVSADSRWLAMASNNTAYLWDLDSPGLSAQPAVLDGYKFPITALTSSPDNKWLAVADAKTILLLNLAEPDPTANPIILTDHFLLSAIAFNADGSLLAAGNSDGVVRLWDLTSTDPANAYFDVEGQSPAMYAIAFSQDRHWMITAGADARLLDISSTLFNSAPLILNGYENPVSSIKISSNSRWLVTLDNDTSLRLWDLDSPQPHSSPITLGVHSGYGSIPAIATSPIISRWLVTVGGNGIALWDLTIHDFQISPIILSDKNVNNPAISPDNRWLAATSQDGSALLWDLNALKTNAEPRVLIGHTDGVTATAFSADSRWLATGSQDRSVFVWDLTSANPTEKPTILHAQSGSITQVSFSPNGRWLIAIGLEDSTLWDLTDTDSSKYTSMSIGKEFPDESAVFSADNHWLAIAGNDVRLLDLTSPNPEIASTLIGMGSPIEISPNSLWLVGLKDNIPQLVNPQNLTSDPIPLVGHEGRIVGMSFSSDGNYLFTGSWDDTARIWNLESDAPGSSAVILHSPENWLPHINALAITPDDRWLIAGTDGGFVYLWTLQQEELVSLACQTAGRNLYKIEWEQYFKIAPQKTCPQWPLGQ